jgi:hypothetical protein
MRSLRLYSVALKAENTDSVLEGKAHLTGTKTEYLLTQWESAAIVSVSTPLWLGVRTRHRSRRWVCVANVQVRQSPTYCSTMPPHLSSDSRVRADDLLIHSGIGLI